jgi:arylsulfatase A-like enzyme/tetratricopeptide (TPR) repeat protein
MTVRFSPVSCLVVVMSAAIAFAAGCGRDPEPDAAPAARPNVLLVTIDTLRADHVGSYGARNGATPVLDALAERGVRFETAMATAPLTGPSHATILTGLTPLGHGFRNNSGFALPASVPTAGEMLQKAGYRTAAVVSGFPLDRRFGFSRGFGDYDDHLPKGNDRRRTPYVERPANQTTDAALAWLKGQGSAPWFLWVHYYDPHAPYEPPADLGARFKDAPYDGEIAFVDREIDRLLQQLSSTGALARTLTLVTSDHGEGLGEHGEGTHGLFLYDTTLRVPWIMAGPGVPQGMVPRTVARTTDILPTLLDYAGVPAGATFDGRTLRPAADGQELDDAPAYAESLYSELELGWAPLHAVRLGRFKLIDAPRAELYDLAQDAAEQVNRLADDAGTAARLRKGLQSMLQRTPPAATAPTDPEAARRLTALGYVSGNTQKRLGGGPLRDPKDGVRLLPRLNRGMSAARVEPEVAIRELTSVLAEDPHLLMARRTRAVAYEAAGKHALAIADLRALQEQAQLTAEDAVVLGDNLRFAGKLDEAAKTLEQTARENPQFPQPLLSLGEVRIQQERFDDAAALFGQVLALVPDHIEALRRLGDLDLRTGDLASAESRYARIVALDAGDAQATMRLGVVRMRGGRGDEAVALFERATSLEPDNAEALLYLAGGHAARGQFAQALPYFERAVKAAPSNTMALNGMGLTLLQLGERARAAATLRQSLKADPDQPEVARQLADLRGASR